VEEALRQAEQKYRTIFENTAEGIYQSLPTGQIITANPAMARMLGYRSPAALIATLEQGEQQLYADPEVYQAFQQMLDTYKVVREFEVQLVREDGSHLWASLNTHEVRDDNGRLLYYEGTMSDISERKQLVAENESLAAQFYQAQKMESIGRLAGGIAHDFNNLLVPIIGYAELGTMNTTSGEKLHTHFTRIEEAARRSAILVRQILAFSRQQILQMRVLDLNQVITEFQPMLQSMIGEDVILQVHLAPRLQTIEADQSQIEQILMNLGVNARDAMPDGGSLIIETANVELDETYTAKYLDIEPGSYVMLAVSDTGQGMDTATQANIFEPFFTTKPRDKGTGLGLATVFGIVKQHNGNIWVYSELGQGTTFKIYLPITETAVAALEPTPSPINLLQGTESVFVVEDEASVRQLVCETLEANGYTVLESGDPEEALAFMETHQGQIDLLLTDVIMPKMNGPELYKQLQQTRPTVKVLYMSGYTDNVMMLHSKVNEEATFLQKPFAIRVLLQKVRKALQETVTPN
jgi:PAS domain S-box-containing protein